MQNLRTLFFLVLALVGLQFQPLFAGISQPKELEFGKNLSLTEIFHQAKSNHKKILVYVAGEEESLDNIYLEEKLNENAYLSYWLTHCCVTYKFAGFSEMEKMQFWNVHEFPAILMSDDEGNILFEHTGIYSSQEISLQIEANINPEDAQMIANILDSAPEEESPLFTVQRGDDNSAISDIEGLKPFTIMNQSGYGLIFTPFRTKSALLKEYSTFRKAWHGKTSMFVRSFKGEALYYLVLGAYDTKEEAETMKQSIYNGFFIHTNVESFEKLQHNFIENESPSLD